jgi:hypothetical protein
MTLSVQTFPLSSNPSSSQQKKAVDESALQERLASLVEKIKHLHNEIGTLHSRALEHASSNGEWLKETKVLCKRLKEGWGKWVEGTITMKRKTASIYVRIFKNWAKLDECRKRDDRSIAGAICFLRGVPRVPASKPIAIPATDFLATAAKSGVSSEKSLHLQQFVNEILHLAKIGKTIAIKHEN